MATIQPLTPPPPRSNEIAQGDKTPANIQYYGWFIKLQKVINALIAAGGGGGGVTQIVAGTGITVSPAGGTGVVTVSATGGSGGITDITSTDGSVVITNPTGPTTNLSVPGGIQFNITPDSHPVTPAGVGLGPNDEFESGTSIDLTGSRYPGATAWAAFHLTVGAVTGTNAVGEGSLAFTPALTATRNIGGYVQPVASGTYTYQAKMAGITFNGGSGNAAQYIFVSSASGQIIGFGITGNGITILVQKLTNFSTFSSNAVANSQLGVGYSAGTSGPIVGSSALWLYFRIAYNGTNVSFLLSYTGIPGSFTTVFSEPVTTFLGTAPTVIGLAADNESATVQSVLVCDHFRRIA